MKRRRNQNFPLAHMLTILYVVQLCNFLHHRLILSLGLYHFVELVQFICTIGGNLCNKVWLDQTDYIHNCSSMETLEFGCILTIMQENINISKKYKSRVISLATFISMKDLIQKLRTTLLFWLAVPSWSLVFGYIFFLLFLFTLT